jgi:hypothetical protein
MCESRQKTKNRDSLRALNRADGSLGILTPWCTFALGLILIELAYQAPLQSLREPSDFLDDSDRIDINFRIADRISTDMVSEFGLPYKKIVRKCINCDFGEGFDLTSPLLQAAFHRDVVCELEGLERRFKELYVDQ